MRRILLTLVIFLLATFSPSYAILNFEDHAFPEFITSARALAMGNAFLCKTDDPWAVFYNPAGLGTVRKSAFHPGNFHFELNKGFMNVTEGAAEDIPKKIVNNFKEDNLRQNLLDHPDNIVHTRINLFPNFTTRYFSMGYLFSRRSRAALSSATSPMDISIRQDHGPLVGLNLSLWGGILKFGASGVYLHRDELQKEYDASAAIDIPSSDYKKGNALILTAGGRLTFPVTFLPTFAGVIRNTGATTFHPRNKDTTAPDRVKQTVDVGFSITPQFASTSRIHLEVNYKDINNQYKTNSKRRIGAGMEIDINRTFFLRGGYGDGFGSGGIGINSKRFTIDLTSYAIDKTESEFRGKEDRRFVLSLSSGL
jgi:hypothetical protein